jgi:hypothetical protein
LASANTAAGVEDPSVKADTPPETRGPGITFAVDSVSPAERPIWSEPLAASLERRFRRKIIVLPEEQLQVVNEGVDGLDASKRSQFAAQIGSRCHPLIDAVHIAFSQHRPLNLSPDAIWLTIAQGFGHHVLQNAEELRPRLVRHEGTRDLTVEVEQLTTAGFERAIADFSDQIRQQTDPVLHETLVCDFSTTTRAIRTASEVALMDTYSSYFAYAMMCVCGIPKITIEGNGEDWRSIRARIEVLATFGLEWWVRRLRPILDEFVLAAEGRPTPEFWKAIYKPKQAYAREVVTGWITDLFPYLGDAPNRMRNPVLENERTDWALRIEDGVQAHRFSIPPKEGVSTKSFPSGLSSVPLKVSFPDGSRRGVDLVAGFFAVRQGGSDLALSPVIGWCVAEPPPKKPVTVMP